MLLLPLALLAGLAAGAGITFVMSQLRAVFYDARVMGHTLGLPVLGVVTLVMDDGTMQRRKTELKRFFGATGGLVAVFIAGMAVLFLLAGRAG
jgi:hypothetical protein